MRSRDFFPRKNSSASAVRATPKIFLLPQHATCRSTVSAQEKEKNLKEKVNDQTTPLAEKESSNTHAARGELTENHKTIKRE